MPVKGYRKGERDGATPLPCSLRTHVPATLFEAIAADATARRLTRSKLARQILAAHYGGRRPNLPHARPHNPALFRQLIAIGNNLNQLTKLANQDRLPGATDDLAPVLARLNSVLLAL